MRLQASTKPFTRNLIRYVDSADVQSNIRGGVIKNSIYFFCKSLIYIV